jgi:SAM-dependent methyltransferase
MAQSARRWARKGVDQLPDQVRRPVLAAVSAAREARRSGAVEPVPAGRLFEFPDDVADRDALRDYLADTDIFGPAEAEAHGYLHDALDRFRITMALLPDLAPGARILELGANPYFLTRLLLRRGYKVTAANYFGEQFSGEPVQVVTGARHGERHVFEFDHFNVERERFPYDDDSFDLVLFCEILEHLPFDPIHTLAEIHRVLAKPGGRMVLTTPNAIRTRNLLRVLAGDNPYEELSGYGTYGRHNREYTVRELRELLGALNFEVEDVFAADIHPDDPPVPAIGGVDPGDRGDNLFAVARAAGEPRWHYPPWLYSSRHALHRVVAPDVRAGHNDELQAVGLHPAEQMPGGWACWTEAERVVFTVEAPAGGRAELVVDGLAPPPAVPGPVVVTIGGTRHEVACDNAPFTLRATVSVEAGVNDVAVEVAPTWSPAEVGINADPRRLGVAIRRVAVES